MNKIVKIISVIIFITLGFIAGYITVGYFDKEPSICVEEFSDMDYVYACNDGCNQLGKIYEEKFNITQDFDAYNRCSEECMQYVAR